VQAATTLYKALADDTRVNMIWLLLCHRELCVCDLMELLGTTQSRASRHLRALFQAELVSRRRVGQWVYYTLRRDHNGLIPDTLEALRVSLSYDPRAVALRQALKDRLAAKKEEGYAAC
jgi:ArsR family transcriptional regulator, arsenate/arsenite/antimonite-responsive transcriptional repressor